MKSKTAILNIVISIIAAGSTTWLYNTITEQKKAVGAKEPEHIPSMFINYKGYAGGEQNDFSAIAENALPAIVQVKAMIKQEALHRSPFDIFDDEAPSSLALSGGSGVLIKEDGYIVTNEHVIGGALEVMVTLNNKKAYKATVVGSDKNSDLAVLKIDGADLPHLSFGNSEQAKLGQWVLAIGYPLNLDATVTAGIISGKSRAIGVNKGESPIESFIQTDAVINIGSSGGALVNTEGDLIGITSSLLSPNGTYVGYSFAIPSNIVKKIAFDLIKFGKVRRDYMAMQ